MYERDLFLIYSLIALATCAFTVHRPSVMVAVVVPFATLIITLFTSTCTHTYTYIHRSWKLNWQRAKFIFITYICARLKFNNQRVSNANILAFQVTSFCIHGQVGKIFLRRRKNKLVNFSNHEVYILF